MADTAYQDLLKDTSESKENGNYFLVTITDLEPNTSYPLEFRWTYKDKKVNENWSAVKLLLTPGESEPNTPAFGASNVDVSSPEKIIITWDGTSDDGGGVQITNYDRVDVYIDGAPFDGTKAAYSFKSPGTATIAAPAGTYQIVLYAISKTGKLSPVSEAVTKTVIAAGETIENPTNPNGFSSRRILAGIEVSWAGTYANGTFTGFEAIKIYAGTSATATSGTYTEVGVLTGNNVKNTIIVPVDGTYVAYGQATYIHAAAVNKNGTVGTIQENVTNQSLGPGKATDADINDGAVVISKLASDVLTVGNLKAGDINSTSYIRAGTAGSARVEISSSTVGSVLPGLTVYDSAGNQLLRAPLTGGLTITGGGTFTGDLSAGSGNSIFKSDSSGIYLGNASYASAPFSVSRNGIIKAESGTIGGWTLGSTYLQGNNLKLDTSGITVGSTSNKYLDISPSSITLRNANGTDAGIFTLTTGTSASLSISGTIALNASSTIDGTSASTVKSGAVSGSTAIQSGNGVSKNASNQINQILLNSSGIGIYTATSGTRMQLTNSGLELWNGSTQTVGINATTGSAFFKGDISGASGTFEGAVSSNSVTATGGQIGGFYIGSNYISSILNDPSTNAYYWSASSGAISVNNIYVKQASGSSGINMLNGANINMAGGQLITSTGGIVNINNGSLQAGLGTVLNIDGSNGNITTVGYTGVGTTSGTASDYDDGSYLGPTGVIISRRDGFLVGSSSLYFAHRYYDSSAGNTNPSFFRALRDGSVVGNLRYNTSTNVFETATSSDYRLKENISEHNLVDSAEIIKNIPLKRFSFKSDPEKNIVTGFIAHELQSVAPFAVSGEKDGLDEEGNPDYQEVGFSSLIPDTVAALQHALNKIDELEQRLDALQA